MNSIRVANLKSIKDSGVIELKPITILVGRNSSGKSSLLRLFSLLRQSIEVRTRSPFLWYGQYVDFGSFKEALRHDADPQQIIFEFSFDLTDHLINSISLPKWSLNHIIKRLDSIKNSIIRIELTLSCFQEKTYISDIIITIGDDSITLSFDSEEKVKKFYVNDLNIISLTQEFDVLNIGKIIPSIKVKTTAEDSNKRRNYFDFVYGGTDDAIITALAKESFIIFHGNASRETRYRIVKRFGIEPLPQFSQNLLSIPATGIHFQTYVKMFAEKQFMKKIRNMTIASIVPSLLFIADEELSRVSNNVRSIAPVRATAERYYRKQDLGIEEVDYKGQNLAMYLSGLNENEMTSFQNWTNKNLKFYVSVKDSAGHIEISLQEKEGAIKYNLADSGFGYSQIIPIVAQLWSMINPSARNRVLQRQTTNFFTIEQPELHLHPSLQAKVSDLLIASITVAKEKDIKLKLIVETHSEAVINRIGNQIAKGKLSSQDVNIVIFEKKGPNESTEISVAEYDQEGYLKNWPYGFFEAEED